MTTPATIRETLLTAPYGSKALLDAVEAAIDAGGNGLLAAFDERLEEDQRERDELFEPKEVIPMFLVHRTTATMERTRQKVLRRWLGLRMHGAREESEEE